MANFKTQIVYVEGGQYSITSSNIPKFVEDVKAYQKGEWRSNMWNFLGLEVNFDKGTTRKAKRYSVIVEALKDAEEPAAIELRELMEGLEFIPVDQLKRTVRMKPSEKAELRRATLNSLIDKGFPKELAEKMAKAI